jgi:class 3 adenylate cyclase
MKKIFILLLFLMPFALRAQNFKTIKFLNKDSLTHAGEIWFEDGWKFCNGDDSAWAAKEYNDSGWASNVRPYINMESKAGTGLGFSGLGWFRYHFHTDSSLNHFPLALMMEQSGASVIYLDGRLIQRYGEFKKDGLKGYVNPKEKPLQILVPDSGEHVFAVRYENYDAAARLKKVDVDMAGFKIKLAAANMALELYVARDRSIAFICLTVGCIFFALFLVHIILFMFYRIDKSNLYFSLFNLGIAAFIFLAYIGLIAQGIAFEDALTPFVYVFLGLACLSISMFVNVRFGKSKIRSRIVWLLCLAAMVVPFFTAVYTGYYMSFVAILIALEAVILLSYAMYKRIPGSRIIGTGILFFVFFFATVIIVALVGGSGDITVGQGVWALLLVLLAILAIFSIPFSMSGYLAWSFATANRNLSLQLKQVEQLSKEALQYEQEKQQLLNSRKEELEREVAIQTAEVIHQKEQIEHQHEALKAEKKKSDELLLNILPAEVAEELKEKGKSKAQAFDHVTVLFTDFVNFTQISERLTAEALVTELHECFMAFDAIMERHGMEKIKTIGDAYLAVSGMPVYNEKHARNAVLAGLEILNFIKHRNQHENTFKIRIGIHSGPLIAGIVGVKKFAYDIWGDTVNTASRMESSGEAGKVNISEATHKLVEKDFTFTYRGKIEAKNKGAIDMYFVDGLI